MIWNPDTTPNFSIEGDPKLICSHTGENGILQETMDALQALRERWGKPLVITSGYRSSNHPIEAKKRFPGSHAQGRAIDIACPHGPDRIKLTVLAVEVGFAGFGWADTFLHLDIGHDYFSRPHTWTYN